MEPCEYFIIIGKASLIDTCSEGRDVESMRNGEEGAKSEADCARDGGWVVIYSGSLLYWFCEIRKVLTF